MHKDTKQQLHKLTRELDETLGREDQRAILKQIDFGVTDAWKESQAQNFRVQQKIRELTRLDEQEITRRVAERCAAKEAEMQRESDRLRDRLKAQQEEACERAHQTVAQVQAEAKAVMEWFFENVEESDLYSKSFRVLYVGEHSALRANNLGEIAIHGFFESVLNNVDNAVVGDFHVVLFCDPLPTKTLIYICVFAKSEWATFSADITRCWNRESVTREVKKLLKAEKRKQRSAR